MGDPFDSFSYDRRTLLQSGDPHSLTEDRCSFEPLEADKDFHVTREAIETFEPLVERFLVNGKINSQSISV